MSLVDSTWHYVIGSWWPHHHSNERSCKTVSPSLKRCGLRCDPFGAALFTYVGGTLMMASCYILLLVMACSISLHKLYWSMFSK